jgi:hypothetical protein
MATTTTREQGFALGCIYWSPGASALLGRQPREFGAQLLLRHQSGDWGDVDEDDIRANEVAVKYGASVSSVYTVDGERLWVVSEGDRSATTVLTPGDRWEPRGHFDTSSSPACPRP